MNKDSIGTSLDEFLDEESLLDDAEAIAVKRVIAWQVQEEMKKQHVSKTLLAKRMRTSRAVIDRILDPKNTSLTLKNIEKTARALNMHLEIRLCI
jgi:antitoxin HicB